MKKLRLIEPGWDKFTGDFGTVQFQDGVSVDPVSPVLSRRLANAIQVEMIDDEGVGAGNPSDSQMVIDFAATPASANMNDKVESAVNAVQVSKLYTREELSQIADEGGIAAVRKIADGYGVKSNSIGKLIELVLQKQAELASPSPEKALGLLGSSVQPSMFIIDGKEFTLGDIVRVAFDDSGMATCEWNEQDPQAREALIAAAVAKLGATGKVAQTGTVEQVELNPVPPAEPAPEAPAQPEQPEQPEQPAQPEQPEQPAPEAPVETKE